MFFCQLHDRHKRGQPFSHGLAFGMPRPFKRGIACHGSMPVRPFSHNRFVALYNDNRNKNLFFFVYVIYVSKNIEIKKRESNLYFHTIEVYNQIENNNLA